MSDNSKDERDDYDTIFGGGNSKVDEENSVKEDQVGSSDSMIDNDDLEIRSSDDVVLPKSVIHSTDDPETDNFQVGLGSSSRKVEGNLGDHDSDTDDQDGFYEIFDPVHLQKPKRKKSGSLMWAVSLLAVVGVGAFVYISNPDILSKVRHNIETGDGAESSPLSPALNIDESDMEAIKPEVVQPDSLEETAENPDEAEQVRGTVVEENAETVSASSIDKKQAPEAKAEAKAEGIVEEKAEPELKESLTEDTKGEAKQEPIPEVGEEENSSSHLGDSSQSVPGPAVVSGSEKGEPTASPAPSKGGALLDSPPASSLVSVSDSKEANGPDLSSNTETSKLEPAKDPVIIKSTEEQKVLDDANLDQYFDSPGGQILQAIPAPSMNPKKGKNESVIVVHKESRKKEPPSSKSVGKVKIETTPLDTKMVSADRALKLGRYEAAREMYDELYQLNPRDIRILSGRAVLMQKMGLSGQAILAYEELLNLYPNDTDAIVNLSGLIRKEYPALALGKLLDLHMNHPGSSVVTAQLGVAYAESGNYTDALRYLGEAAAMDPQNALHFYNMAVISEKASKPDQAVMYYEKALELDAIYSEGRGGISKEKIYDRLARIRRN